ncbi:MAG: hypothetical protein JNL28_09800 [Planctomycetes bacterium]|nr:hypothetical protein [Planctomycetota bacterium]
MFDPAQLQEAVEIQNRGYRLIRWLGDAIDRGVVTFTTAHHYTSDSAAAAAWIDEHFQNVPSDARPHARTPEALERFGNYFASYLTTSFELIAKPGLRLKSACGCNCFCCSYLAAAPHLETRKLTPADKKRASKMQARYLAQLALDHGLFVTNARIAELVEAPDIDEATALAAYSVELLARCSGVPSTPASLALWRKFAWKKAGSPKQDFAFRAEEVLAAEARLLRVMQTAARDADGAQNSETRG